MQKEDIKFSSSVVFEGMTSIRAIIKGNEYGCNDRKIVKILFDEEKYEKNKKDLGYLKAISNEMNFQVIQSTAEELDKLTLGNSHGGIIAICESRSLTPFFDNINLDQKGFYVLIQGIEDPYNFGYSIRSLYAMGVSGIILSPRNWMSAAGVVCRSSAGASEMLNIYISDDDEATVKEFKKMGFKVVCADERTDNELGKCSLPCPLLLIVGGEKRGISRSILDLCDARVKIPYGRDFRASLSAASATTMFAYEILRQNPELNKQNIK